MTGWLRGIMGSDDAADTAAEAAQVDAAGYGAAGDVLGEGAQEAANRAAAGMRQGGNITAAGFREAANREAAGYRAGGELTAAGYEDAAAQAAEGYRGGGNLTSEGYERAINYLTELEDLPKGIRDEALQGLSEFYQVPNQPMGQEQLIEQARNSPLYAAMMGTRKSGEDAILRGASATGGLRSGNVQHNLYDYNVDLENRSLLTSYSQAQNRDDYARLMNLQGLEGLGALQVNNYEGDIAGLMQRRGTAQGGAYTAAELAAAGGTSAAGETRGRSLTAAERAAAGGISAAGEVLGSAYSASETTAAAGRNAAAQAQADAIRGSTGAHVGGQLAAGQIKQQGTQNALDLILGGGQMLATVFCDIRLKEDIRYLGNHQGINLYGWVWNELAAELGLEGPCSGVMAHEIYEIAPEATSEKDGYVQVDYNKLLGVH